MRTQQGDNRPCLRRFRIYVAGRLDPMFIEGIDGIELGHSAGGSTLEGPLIDQSYLRGLLERFWQLGIEVTKFETFLSETPDPQTSRGDGTSSP